MEITINDLIGYTHERIDDSADNMSLLVQDDAHAVIFTYEGIVGNPDSSMFQVEESFSDINTFEVDGSPVTTPNKTMDTVTKSLDVPLPGYLPERG